MPLNIIEKLRKLTWTRDSSGNNWYVENGGSGSAHAAPAAKKVIEAYMDLYPEAS